LSPDAVAVVYRSTAEGSHRGARRILTVATVNSGAYATGFNDRGADNISHWYNPAKNFTPPQVLEGMRAVLAHQLEPQAMADVIVDVVLSETPKFRNVYSQETEDLNSWDPKGFLGSEELTARLAQKRLDRDPASRPGASRSWRLPRLK
jgi:hypothetical protein